MRESILPAIVRDFTAKARELEEMGLFDAANALKAKLTVLK